MPKYQAAYRCRICNALIPYKEPIEGNRETCSAIVSKVVGNSTLSGNLAALRVDTVQHNCKDGSVGVAVFAGMVRLP